MRIYPDVAIVLAEGESTKFDVAFLGRRTSLAESMSGIRFKLSFTGLDPALLSCEAGFTGPEVQSESECDKLKINPVAGIGMALARPPFSR